MENRTQHNPGPWKVFDKELEDYNGVKYHDYFLKDSIGHVFTGIICRTHEEQNSEEEMKAVRANIALMSSAPELLDFLKEAVLEFGCVSSACDMERECIQFDRKNWRCKQKSGKCFIQRWLAAIRKAEGLKYHGKSSRLV